jgi:hypothetical protein
MNFLPKIDNSDSAKLAKAEDKLLRQEAEIGGKLFGPLPKGHQRQFFCLDERTWVWYESWSDAKGTRHTVNTRYDIRQNGIYKVQNDGGYQTLSDNELKNLYHATQAYFNKFNSEYQAAV